MSRGEQEPTLDQWGAEVHPAFGNITMNRSQISAPGSSLFDSEIRPHQRSTTMTTIAGAAADHVQTVLASRITIASRAVDMARSRKPFEAHQYASVAEQVASGIAIIGELERLWEGFFGYVPSALEVGQKQAVDS